MSASELRGFLTEPLVCVLSVARQSKGPVAVPLGFVYAEDRFLLVTSPSSFHGRLMQQRGRATITVHDELYGEKSALERYVMAEGPVAFTTDDVEPIVRRMLAKERRRSDPDAWAEHVRPNIEEERVAVLSPERISGYVFRDHLD